jgi:hypothetical protein
MTRPASLRVAQGEEIRFTADDPASAELRSRGRLPLRVRTEARHHARPEFPGSAVVVHDATYEVLSETERPDEGLFVYALRPWPEGEVTRDRVVYGPSFVRAVQEERARERVRARVRPWRHFLYPVVGLLPEEQQERVCERLGLYSVTATLVSGLCESLGVLALVSIAARHAEPGLQILLVAGAPGLMFLVLPGLGRAAGAVLFHETAGSPLLGKMAGTLSAFREALPRRDAALLPLTRRTFWARLARPDEVEARGEARVHRSRLPHVTWTPGRTLLARADYWKVVSAEPALEAGGVAYRYVLEPQGDEAAEGDGPPPPPSPSAYADEVLAGVRDEWDDFNRGFGWLTTLFARESQARAFDHRGGPAAAARATRVTAVAEAVLGAYLASFLPGGPAADPVAPAVFGLGLTLAGDGLFRYAASRAGRYAPSLLRFALPVHLLRPERRPYEAHREAEREALRAIR